MNKVGAGTEIGRAWEAPNDFSVALTKPSWETCTEDWEQFQGCWVPMYADGRISETLTFMPIAGKTWRHLDKKCNAEQMYVHLRYGPMVVGWRVRLEQSTSDLIQAHAPWRDIFHSDDVITGSRMVIMRLPDQLMPHDRADMPCIHLHKITLGSSPLWKTKHVPSWSFHGDRPLYKMDLGTS